MKQTTQAREHEKVTQTWAKTTQTRKKVTKIGIKPEKNSHNIGEKLFLVPKIEQIYLITQNQINNQRLKKKQGFQ